MARAGAIPAERQLVDLVKENIALAIWSSLHDDGPLLYPALFTFMQG
jgi:hypothetical protein